MSLPDKPILTPAPDAPVRGEDPATFANKANAFVAWQANDLRPDLQGAIDWTDGALDATVAVYDDTVVARNAAQYAQTGSEAAQSASETARDLALGYRDTAEIYKDGAESAAAAAQSAAGLPAIEGKANFVLRVRSDGLSVEWGEVQKVADTIVTARALTPPEYLPCDGSLYLASSYPELSNFLNTGLFAFDFNAVTSGFGADSIRSVATDGEGVWVAGGASGTMTRSIDNGVTWASVTSGFGTAFITSVATDGEGVWVAGGTSGIMARSTDNGVTWEAVTSGFGDTGIRSIATDGAGVWVAVGDSGTMTRSENENLMETPDTPMPAPLNRYIYTGVSA